jgi:hypothetical protein
VGPYPEQFAPDGRPTHSEGLVVRFLPREGEAWVGNFQRGLSKFDAVVAHPNGDHVIVIAGGQAYVVEPTSRKRKDVFGAAIVCAHPIANRRLVILDHQGIMFEAIGVDGRVWTTPRLSWDGFKNVSVDSSWIRGLAWRFDDTWHAFEVDVATGMASGGAFEGLAPGH